MTGAAIDLRAPPQARVWMRAARVRCAALLAAGLASLAVAAPSSADEGASRAASENFTRIVGGVAAKAGAWPWQVALVRPQRSGDTRTRQFCGGSVIAPRWVLTAAHCVVGDDPADLQVLVGTRHLDRGGRRIDVQAIRVHEGYSNAPNGNDIALLKLARPVGVPAVGIASEKRTSDLAAPGTMATVTGWGLLRPLSCKEGVKAGAYRCRTRDGKRGHRVDGLTGRPVDPSDVRTTRLMEVEMPLVGEATCRAAYPGKTIDRTTLCAGLRRGGKDSCQGDSGGPLVVSDGADWVQAGIVSWGAGCATPGKYGVYTGVGAFADWIEAKTGLSLVAAEGPAAPEEPPQEQAPSAEAPPAPEEPAQEEQSPEDTPSGGTGPQDTPAAPAASLPQGNRALLIGIDRYADAKFTDLRGAVRDARNMGRLLSEHLGFAPGQIRVLTDTQATRQGILAGVKDWLLAGTRPGDRALLYFAGHGYFQPDEDGDEADGYDEVLIPHDARLVSDAGRPMKIANFIRDDEVGALLDELRDRQVQLIVDSCHAGTMTRSLAPPSADPHYARTLGLAADKAGTRSAAASAFSRSAAVARQRDAGFVETEGDLVAWTAVSSLQVALEDREAEEPQGVFTSRFVSGIAERRADRDGDGHVVHAELLDYLRTESAAYCKRQPGDCEAGLTPMLEGPRDLLVQDVVTGETVSGTSAAADGTLGHDNQAGVHLEIRPSSKVRIGEAVTYRVESGRAGHLLIVDVAADGTVTQLFPNEYSEQAGRGAAIAPGRAIEIPNAYYGFRLVAAPPTGRGTLFAIVTEDPVSLDDLLGPHRDLRPVADAEAWLLALGERLRQPWLGEDGTREARWSAARVAYEIVP